ncbi:SDR family oxidoreductase [Paenibacillus radicis (ex Gao et al. 2016)]|uniref:Short-chain dehydrogenase n=1 Tax=Paenibacillus radicis (ex Gao et al. 2016) TaxID=1737354 RepID=A0A917LZH6_9BACL|nr:SDR family oxidoreductase [Paenibacillus radicis (ex Gao et al. 2016)]GGG67993.1 short-chain dehydrogenase [Paenibacillus radicis (ex Gao et al. 2016)]
MTAFTQDLTGKVALITGATRGIGLETARGLSKLGAHVIIGGRDQQKADNAVKLLAQEGLKAEGLKIDVNEHADHEEAYAYLEKKYGKLDILINNAGILRDAESASHQIINRTSTISEGELRETFDVNFFAPIVLTQTLLPLIRKSDAGRIVNLSSALGSLQLQADPASPFYPMKTFAYNASKAALNAFTIHLAAELKDTPIKVNSIHPGWVQTEMGGQNANVDIVEGSRTSIIMATLPADGPTGGFFHLENPLPW